MKKKDMVNMMRNHIEAWSNLPEDNIYYGDGYGCCEQLLEKMEKAGMSPPEREREYIKYYIEGPEIAKFKEKTWEEDE